MRYLALAFLALPLASSLPGQHALLRRRGDLTPVAVPGGDLRSLLETTLAGPTAAQAAAGLGTSIPAGTRLLALEVNGDRATITLDDAFEAALAPDGQLEDAIEQLVKVVVQSTALRSVLLRVRTADGRVQSLGALLGQRDGGALVPPAPAGQRPTAVGAGALAGKRIAVSPGHGYYWNSSLGWTTQRPTIGGLTEDFHTNEIAMRYLIPALENMGAVVISCRERGEITAERVVDNDTGPGYSETGTWFLSTFSGYNGGSYRYTNVSSMSTATATWTAVLPHDGLYPVYVLYRAGSNRTTDARYRIYHAGGITEVSVDQTRDDLRWVHLGDFWFEQVPGARVELDNRSSGSGVVIADVMRFGAGNGSIVRGSGTSGKPRWQEACRYWAQFAGAPSSVYDIAGYADNEDDVTARPKYAEWRGADAFISLHTNAGGGSGTSSYIHNTSPTAGSAALQSATHSQIINDIRKYYDPSWVDRGNRTANFGEVRALQTMPGVLTELAFHDQPGSKDHDALHDPYFRFIAGRAYARGVLRYFFPGHALPPEMPSELWIVQDGNHGLRLAWTASAGATAYSIEQSSDGKGFVEVAQSQTTSWSTGPLPHGTALSFRIRACNSTGRSFPTEVLTAGTSHTGQADVLLVQGFDRLGKTIKLPDNTKDYLRLHGDAIRRHREFSLGFDAATNEAVLSGRVQLGSYCAVDWLLGEESTEDETFSGAEQALVSSYLQGGGRLLVSGAEIAWDLDHLGSAADRAFYRGRLGASYVADDANTYTVSGSGGIFAGLGGFTFENGTTQAVTSLYNVDYPDVIAPSDNKSSAVMRYATGGTAAIQRTDGSTRVVNMGFPLESIVDAETRADVMTRALRFLLSPRALENAISVAPGGALPLQVSLPAEPGASYVLAAALALGGVPLQGGRLLPLLPDGVLQISLTPGNGVFNAFQGRLDALGRANASFVVPNIATLRGLDFYFSGVTLDGGGNLHTVLPWTRTRVQ